MVTVPTSSVAPVKNYLFNALAARTEITSTKVLVSYDEPGPFQPDDIIAVMDVERENSIMQMVGSGGSGWIEEEYTMDIVVACYRGGDYAKTVFERAAFLADVVVDVVRQDPSCGGLVNIHARPAAVFYASQWNVVESDVDGTLQHLGRETIATVSVSVRNRI